MAPKALPVRWDRARIEQLLGNLLENSLRYTDAPGRIAVTLERQGQRIFIDIADSAPGVPAADLRRLFEPLNRAELARRPRPGHPQGHRAQPRRTHRGRLFVARRIASSHRAACHRTVVSEPRRVPPRPPPFRFEHAPRPAIAGALSLAETAAKQHQVVEHQIG